MKKAFPWWAVCLFFAVFLALGLLTATDYGPTWDESTEMDILRMNLWEYARVLNLDQSAFEALAAREDPLAIETLRPISQSVEQDHGAAVFYPFSAVVLDLSLSGGTRSALWHMACWAVFSLGGFALYAALRQLGLSRGWALLGPLFLLISPRFFAQGHFNNKDIALFSLTLCALWQALALAKKPGLLRGLCFALFGALAANTKVAGLALWGLCALYVLVRLLMERRMTPRVWGVAGATALSFGLFYALLTPAMWADPVGFFGYLLSNALSFQRWNGYVLFRGSVFDTASQPLPWYYLPYMILATTPLWALLLCAVGTAVALWGGARRLRSREAKGLDRLLAALLWLLPLGFAVVTRTRVYNGWRHFYFLYGPMLALAVLGAHALYQRTRDAKRRLLCALLGLCMALSAVGIVTQHPYQYAYYQPLVQLRGTDYNELDYWNVSARDALERLAGQEEGELVIEPADLWSAHALSRAIAALPDELAGRFTCLAEGSGARYVLSNPTYACFSGFAPEADMAACVTLRAYGQPIMTIYERTTKEADRP